MLFFFWLIVYNNASTNHYLGVSKELAPADGGLGVNENLYMKYISMLRMNCSCTILCHNIPSQ